MLRKRGKEKIRFRVMNSRVTSGDFKYLKRLFLDCLNENRDIAKQLDETYKLIQVWFFYESSDTNVESTLKTTLNDSNVSHSAKPTPAFTQSRKNVGCVMMFLKNLDETTKKREDVKDIEKYHKNGIFEELCHLVEQNGDSSIHSSSYWELWKRYSDKGLNQYGNEIIARIDTDRNHYEVYSMMIKAYADDWVVRYWKYFEEAFDYDKEYERWKKNLPINVIFARLVTDYLRLVNVLYVVENVPREKISETSLKLLVKMQEKGRHVLESRKNLIKKDMGSTTLSVIESLDEKIFRTSDIFFSVILDLWKSLALI
jgi:hypothetical protein